MYPEFESPSEKVVLLFFSDYNNTDKQYADLFWVVVLILLWRHAGKCIAVTVTDLIPNLLCHREKRGESRESNL